MKKSVIIPISILIYWLILALAYKVVFLVYQLFKGQSFSFYDAIDVLTHGLRMDLSMSSYFTILPTVITALFFLFPSFNWKRVLSLYIIIIVALITLLTVIDLELYIAWGYRLDNSFLRFINTPKEMLASSASSPYLLLTALYITLTTASLYAYYKIVIPIFDKLEIETINRDWKAFIISLLLGGLLVIPIRGGLQRHPINESVAYFSTTPFLNHAAVNMPWTFFRSITNESDVGLDDLVFMDKEIANGLFKRLHVSSVPDSILLNKQKPNIVFIIWESLAYQVSDTGATPEFNKLKKEGIYFSNLYANADRSDKGLVSILSGQPAIPGISLMADPRRIAALPSLCATLKANQYSPAIYLYGGDMEFANMRSYMIEMGFDKLIGKSDFPAEQQGSKWGAHDQYTFDRLYQEMINQKSSPFFITHFTLSSHEPFDVPAHKAYSKTDDPSLFMNAHHYTDSCLADFIHRIQKTPYWENTLFVIVGDHGHRLPRHPAYHNNDTTEFHTEMLWLGGAVKYPGMVNPHMGTQSDIATTLLGQMHISADAFIFGKDLFSSNTKNFAEYSYRDGFGWVTPKGAIRYDRQSGQFMEKNPAFITSESEKAKACMQYLIQKYRE